MDTVRRHMDAKYHSNLIHLLWRCLKLHLYWTQVIDKLNMVFRVKIPLNPKCSLLNILEEIIEDELRRIAVRRALFHAHKLMLLLWKSLDPPMHKSWVSSVGTSLLLESHIFIRRGCPGRFEKLWGLWLDTPGLSPQELVYQRLFLCQKRP